MDKLNREQALPLRRDSNLELYRIACMLLIVAHHLVVHSGVMPKIGMLSTRVPADSAPFLLLGMWGKAGINCFVLITGYFMCCSRITWRKFWKLTLVIYFYRLVLFAVFFACGREAVTASRLAGLLLPVWTNRFADMFLLFWLTIPFWNILIQHMTQRQHALLLALMLTYYTVLGSIPESRAVAFGYLGWFGVIYLIASYFRRYPAPVFARTALWGWATVATVAVAIVVVMVRAAIGMKNAYFFVFDSHRPLAVAVAVTSFLWFKNLRLPYSKTINTVAASIFGVLLLHDQSDAVRRWLWKEVVDLKGHLALPAAQLAGYCLAVVAAVFLLCVVIDQLRLRAVERPFFRWYDRRH